MQIFFVLKHKLEMSCNIHWSIVISLTTKMTFPFDNVKLLETLHIVSNVKINMFHINLFGKITLLLFITCSFINLKHYQVFWKFPGPSESAASDWPWSQLNCVKQTDNTKKRSTTFDCPCLCELTILNVTLRFFEWFILIIKNYKPTGKLKKIILQSNFEKKRYEDKLDSRNFMKWFLCTIFLLKDFGHYCQQIWVSKRITYLRAFICFLVFSLGMRNCDISLIYPESFNRG